jgi:hypothetical protein
MLFARLARRAILADAPAPPQAQRTEKRRPKICRFTPQPVRDIRRRFRINTRGEIQKQSAAIVRAGGTLVSVVGPAEARPLEGLAIDFVVEADRGQLLEIVQRVRDGRLRTNIGKVSSLDDAVATFNSTQRRQGKTIVQVRS